MDLNIKLPSNRKFGIFFSIIFFLIALYISYEKLNLWSVLFLFISFLFFIISLTYAELLLPLNKLWMLFGLLLSKITNPIVLGFIFFGFFAPLGLITRIFGRDELKLKNNLKKSSFWTNREKKDVSNSFKNQF